MAKRARVFSIFGLGIAVTWLCNAEVRRLFRDEDESVAPNASYAASMPGSYDAGASTSQVTARSAMAERRELHAGGTPKPSREATQLERRLNAQSEHASTAQELGEKTSAFSSAADCEMLVARGQRAARAKGTVRIAAWNVRWFPDGQSDDSSATLGATDVRWLACSLAFLDVDAVALSEVKDKARSADALDSLVQQLSVFTSDSYVYRMDSCPESNGQHLVWLWNERKLKVSNFRMHGSINPYGEACSGRLRPGFGASLVSPSGLDFHAIAVHLKSGTSREDVALRRRSIEGIGAAVSSSVHEFVDSDVLVLGDMNTMGCEGCSGLGNAAAEAMTMDTRLAALHVPMRRVPAELGCSHYYEGRPSLIDHVIISDEFREVPRDMKVEIHGYCRDYACESLPIAPSETVSVHMPEAYVKLSDHCPIVLSVLDQDLDLK